MLQLFSTALAKSDGANTDLCNDASIIYMKHALLTLSVLTIGVNLFAQQNHNTPQDTSRKHPFQQTLEDVTVSSRYYKKYKHDQSSASLKLNTPLLQLPQNIQEVDRSVITDQQAINVNESITRNVSGAIRNNTADFYSPFIFMRGAAVSTLRNGVDLSMIYYGPMPEDAALIGRMEFIKGPAGFINALGDPAGSFNMVTRQPTGTASRQISLTAGSFDLYRFHADLEGNLDKSKKWQYRLNAVGQKARSFQKFAFNDKWVVDPVVTYHLNNHATLTAEYLYQQQRYRQYLLTVFSPYGFASLPRDFSISDPNKEPVKANEHNGFLTYYNALSSKWQLTTKATYARDHLDGNYFFVSAYNRATPDTLRRRATYERFNSDVFSLQAFVNGQITTGSVVHELLGGIDLNSKHLLAYSGYNDKNANPALYPLSASRPVYGNPFDANVRSGPLDAIATNKQAVQYLAGYAQDELALLKQKLRITLAARLTSSKSSLSVLAKSSVSDLVLTPRAGVSYSILPDFSAYALYDQTYTPQSGISANGGVFLPLKGKNLEAGLKKDWMHGKWNTTVSVYQITRDNIIVTDPATNLQSQLGQTRSKGIEFDLKGEIVKGLNAVINYAYTDSYILKDANKALVGLPTPYRVKHIQNSWLNYRLPFAALRGWSISGGYQWQAGRAGRYPQDGPLPIANVFRLDGGLGWANNHFSLSGLVNNITNRFNYGSAWTRPVGLFAYVPYAPREFRITAGYTF